MDITQLLITIGAIAGVILIGLLAVVPSFLDRPNEGDPADVAEPDEPDEPAPSPPADRSPEDGLDLAA